MEVPNLIRMQQKQFWKNGRPVQSVQFSVKNKSTSEKKSAYDLIYIVPTQWVVLCKSLDKMWIRSQTLDTRHLNLKTSIYRTSGLFPSYIKREDLSQIDFPGNKSEYISLFIHFGGNFMLLILHLNDQ